RHPRGVGLRGGELSLQEVRDQDGRLADGPATDAIAVQGTQVRLTHQTGNAVFAAGLAGFTQVEENARRAIDPVARDERSPYQPQQAGVLLSAIRNWLQQPSVVAGRSDLEDAAHQLHAVLVSVGFDER